MNLELLLLNPTLYFLLKDRYAAGIISARGQIAIGLNTDYRFPEMVTIAHPFDEC